MDPINDRIKAVAPEEMQARACEMHRAVRRFIFGYTWSHIDVTELQLLPESQPGTNCKELSTCLQPSRQHLLPTRSAE